MKKQILLLFGMFIAVCAVYAVPKEMKPHENPFEKAINIVTASAAQAIVQADLQISESADVMQITNHQGIQARRIQLKLKRDYGRSLPEWNKPTQKGSLISAYAIMRARNGVGIFSKRSC